MEALDRRLHERNRVEINKLLVPCGEHVCTSVAHERLRRALKRSL
ncbi:MAG: hypothetical protein QOF33_3962 [Thermomicrobiales bacterium]|jgi:hypothetical protein|nr:hypothetical protein [Thermomicrobiales bacterium]